VRRFDESLDTVDGGTRAEGARPLKEALMGRGLAMAVLGGVVGAAVWGAVAYWTGWSIGLLAVLVGALVGLGMQWGIRQKGSIGTGMACAAIALVSIVCAKLVVAQALAQDLVQEAANVSEADAIDQYASEVYDAYEATGRYMGESNSSGWPSEVYAEAERLWEETPEHEREEYMAALSRDSVRDAEEGKIAASLMLFVFSFGPVNLIILAVGVVTAYRVGRNNNDPREEVAVKPDASNGGLVGGPLSRSGPTAGGAGTVAATTTTTPTPRAAKGKPELDDDDRRGAGIFARLADIEKRENEKAADRREAA
jgi:phosphate/sulfate permease